MNTTSLIPAAQSSALLREIEQQTRAESRAVLATAEGEARAVVDQAHATARRRMREAIADLRREGASRLARARAQLETQTRQLAQQQAIALIDHAWPLLVDTLTARWGDVAARHAWTDTLARHACDRLSAGMWTVEHPADWSTEEQRRFREVVGRHDGDITFVADGNLAAGVRIRAAQASLDATPRGLLADRAGIAGLLLAEIDRPDDP